MMQRIFPPCATGPASAPPNFWQDAPHQIISQCNPSVTYWLLPKNREDTCRASGTRKHVCSLLAALILVAAVLWASPARAVVVLTKDSNVPLAGYLVSRTETRVVIKIPQNNDQWQERSILRSDILELIISVSPERLYSLRPENPRDYYDYAEELAEKQQDPEARDMAIRLYVMAAYLSPDQFGRRAMRGAAAVARRPAEETKFRAMSFLLDDSHDHAVLKSAEPLSKSNEVDNAKDRQAVVQAVRLLRRGEWAAARRVAERPNTKTAFQSLKSQIHFDDFLAACQEKSVSPPLLRQLIAVELALDETLVTAAAETPKKERATNLEDRWSRQLYLGGSQPVPRLDLTRLTEFNPEENVYRNGQWIRAKN